MRNPQSATPTITFALLLIGHGHVARRFAALLDEQRPVLARRYGIRTRVVGIKTRHSSPQPTIDFIREACVRHAGAARAGRLVVVETTTLDVGRGEPATSHVRAALAGGAHVITTNKGPVAFAYRSLVRAAERAGRRFLFEGAVMDGVPIFNLARELLPALRIAAFRGIVNSTTNFILSGLEAGARFDALLRQMQARGIAEADPSLDLEGWDAAAKTAALANVLLDARITPYQVAREGISAATARRALEARRHGRRLKLVAEAARGRGGVSAKVALEEVPADHLFAHVDGQQNMLVLQTDLLDSIGVVQAGGGLTHTAYALLSDLVAVGRSVIAAPAIRQSPTTTRRRRTPSPRARR